MEQLIEEGNALFNQGRTDEALAIAEAAVLSNPSSTSGWSLKTLCHERRGEIAEALECADRLVELNPGSDFDKIRRSTLRQKLQTDLHVPAAPDRRLAVLGSISAIVLVLCVGAIVARVSANSGTTASRSNEAPLTSGLQTPAVQGPATTPQAPTSANQGSPAPYSPPVTNQVSNPPATSNESRNYPQDRREIPPYSGGTLPQPNGYVPTEVVPVVPNVDFGTVGNPKPTGPVIPESHPTTPHDPTDPGPLGSGNTENTTQEKKESPGTIEITVRSGNPGNKGVTSGSEPVGSTGVDAMTRVGNQQFLIGNFAAAAKSYEQAVQNGGDAISLNRRLGQAYERLGRTSDAVNAYQKCMSAIDSALTSGKGDKDRLASMRGVCEQAVKVLQGG